MIKQRTGNISIPTNHVFLKKQNHFAPWIPIHFWLDCDFFWLFKTTLGSTLVILEDSPGMLNPFSDSLDPFINPSRPDVVGFQPLTLDETGWWDAGSYDREGSHLTYITYPPWNSPWFYLSPLKNLVGCFQYLAAHIGPGLLGYNLQPFIWEMVGWPQKPVYVQLRIIGISGFPGKSPYFQGLCLLLFRENSIPLYQPRPLEPTMVRTSPKSVGYASPFPGGQVFLVMLIFFGEIFYGICFPVHGKEAATSPASFFLVHGFVSDRSWMNLWFFIRPLAGKIPIEYVKCAKPTRDQGQRLHSTTLSPRQLIS